MSRSNGGGILFETFATVLRAFQELDGKARTIEIVESEHTNREKRQVLNVLQELQRMGYTRYEQRGMYKYWIADLHELDSFYTREKEYLDELLKNEEWTEQKREYLLQKSHNSTSPESE
ncbi:MULTISPECIES: hypothetical protein [Halobacteriales]|uniref:Uncharacterized protein n=1 Tax=Halorubrum trueperi TaxID=2004704 RepID=A0ABD5UNT1_9EURY|nr:MULTISPECIES: hypothetical protein [Halorussus]NHN59621.1 hypothetical protein [Halorussus sp. JP-T4]